MTHLSCARAQLKRVLATCPPHLLEQYKGCHAYLGLYNSLFQASLDNDFDLVQTLIEKHGVPVDCDDTKAWTALHAAASRGHHEVAQYLLEKGANYQRTSICFPNSITDKTPLGVAIAHYDQIKDDDDEMKTQYELTIKVISQWIVQNPYAY